LGYIKSIELGYGNSKAMAVNENIHSLYTSEKEKSSKEESMRHMLQALSFNLVIIALMQSVDQATDIFPKTMSAEVPNPNDPNIKRTGK
jgi:Na+/H+ antiporter NhaB